MQFAARAHGVELPYPEHIGVGDEPRVLSWLGAEPSAGAAGILTTPGSALRLALEARRAGIDLGRLTLVTIGEPLTEAKASAIRSVGARACSSLGFTEFGGVTYQCAGAGASGGGHVVGDAIAVVQQRRAVDRLGTEAEAFLFTTLRPDARTIVLNLETGDFGALERRGCGCAFEALGWTDRLRHLGRATADSLLRRS